MDYYDESKQRSIREMLDILRTAGPRLDCIPNRDEFLRNGIRTFASSVGYMLINRWKNSWRFSGKETAFFTSTLEPLLGALHEAGPPSTREVIDLRLDFLQCGQILEHKLIGIPEMRAAARIEHFNQSDSIDHVTFQDIVRIGVRNGRGEKRGGAERGLC